jgi:hypothetical protein
MFYDESNNVRYLSLCGHKYNIDNDPHQNTSVNFILAGIAKPYISSSNCDELFDIIKLQPTAPELKFKQVAKGDFPLVLKSKKLKDILKWLVASDYYLHYFNLNMEYWSFIDIIDDVFVYLHDKDKLDGLPMGSPRHILDFYKNALYSLIKIEKSRFLSLMTSFEYPNIAPGKERAFVREINKLIKENSTYRGVGKPKLSPQIKESFIALSRLFNLAKDIDELTLTRSTSADVLIGGFSLFYSDRCKNFRSSKHIFDMEDTIKNVLSESPDQNLKNIDYSFLDSKTTKEIQVSDVICGLLSKYFNFIERNTFDEVVEIKKSLNEEQMDTVNQLRRLIEKSDEKCKKLLFYVMTSDEHDKHRYFLFDK